MPSVYDLKPAFQSLLRPTVKRLAEWGVTANQVTVLAVTISAAEGLCLALKPDATWPLAILPIVLLVRMALNAIDGMLAREFNQKTALGAALNEIGDVVSDACLYLPFAMIAAIHAPLVVVFVLLAVVAEFAGVVAIQMGAERAYDGPMGKSDRAFWMGLLAVLLALGWMPSLAANAFVGVLVILSTTTVINRVRKALTEENRKAISAA